MSEAWTAETLAGLPGLETIPIARLEGRFSVPVDQEGAEREVLEVTRGRITGHLPYSRITTPRGYLVADGAVPAVP